MHNQSTCATDGHDLALVERAEALIAAEEHISAEKIDVWCIDQIDLRRAA